MPGLLLGERLCWLYEVYREWIPDATLTMERFLLLVLELAEQKTLLLSRCDNCDGFWIIDRLEPPSSMLRLRVGGPEPEI